VESLTWVNIPVGEWDALAAALDAAVETERLRDEVDRLHACCDEAYRNQSLLRQDNEKLAEIAFGLDPEPGSLEDWKARALLAEDQLSDHRALTDGRIKQSAAERDEARAQVQRLEAEVARLDQALGASELARIADIAERDYAVAEVHRLEAELARVRAAFVAGDWEAIGVVTDA
jgi:hypothetical protein